MKRIGFIVGILIFCLSTAVLAADTEISVTPLPAVGEIVSGFKAVSTDTIPELNATTMLFEHEESGAQVFYIQNTDNNLALATTFQTYPYSDKGMAHVLEHSLLSASESYPGNSVFFDLMSRGYFSFINAFTYQDYTCYPFSTTSEKEFMNVSDIYLDMLLHPALLTEPRIFMREGIRYELDDKNADLKPVGVVYNEMQKSNSDLNTMALYNAKRVLYPDTPDQYESGGNPSEILKLTYADEMEFYRKYYDPSRAKIVIYGNLDYRAFLDHVNQRFFSGVKKTEPLVMPAEQTSFNKVKFETFKQPVSKDTNTTNQDTIYYVLGLPRNIPDEDRIGLQLLVDDVFNNDSFPLHKKLMDSGIAMTYSANYDNQFLQPTLEFMALYGNAEKADSFYQIIGDTLKEETDKGLSKELLSAVVEKELMNAKLIGESSAKGLTTVLNVVNNWQLLNQPLFQAKFPSRLEDMKEKINQGFFEDLIRKYILNNSLAAVVSTVPEAGLLEKNDADLENILAEKKAAMSDDEIQALADQTQDFSKWTKTTDTPQSTLDKLSAMTVADLPESMDHFDIKDETKDGIRTVSAVSKLPDVSDVNMSFDISGLDTETLQYLNFYLSLCGNLPTEKYSAEELALKLEEYLYAHGEFVESEQVKYRSSETKPKMRVSWIYLDQNSSEAMDLMHEILYKTKLEKGSLSYLKNKLQENLGMTQYSMSNLMYYSLIKGASQVDESTRFSCNFNYESYQNFLNQLSADLEKDPDAVFAKLDAARKAALNKNGLIVSYIGPEGAKTAFDQDIQLMTQDVSSEVFPETESNPEAASEDEGVIADTSVYYNTLQARDEGIIPYSNALDVIASIVGDKVMYPKIREEGGAYGGSIHFSEGYVQLYSYQDPNIKKSLDVFRSVPEFLKTLEISQEDLDHYVITTYPELEDNSGNLSKAMSAVSRYLIGETDADYMNEFEEVKKIKPEDLAKVGSQLEEALKNSSLLVVADADQINENKDLFKTTTDIRK